MKKIFTCLAVIFFLATSFALFAADKSGTQEKLTESENIDILQLKQDVKHTANDVEILRRDQINYKIEKDLLKEAYSSNLERINIVITIAFGLLGVFGYLGIRNIKEIKSDYSNELNELKKLKSTFEIEFQSLLNKQNEFDSKIAALTKTNDEQDRRLKVIEFTEKASELIQNLNWQWALQYISLGLDIDPKNVLLLKLKAACLGKIGELSSSIEALKEIIKIQPEDISAVSNCLELLALSGQQDEFEKLYSSYKNKIDARLDGALTIFFNNLMAITSGDLKEATIWLSEYAKKFPGQTKKHLGSWSPDEVMVVASKLPNGKQKEMLIKTVQFFVGEESSDKLISFLAQQTGAV